MNAGLQQRRSVGRLSGARRSVAAFSLIEMLTVIGIIALLFALMMPTLKVFKQGDAVVSATRQMLDDVARARQLAISQRTTVYMIFVPSNFWADPAYALSGNLTAEDRRAATNLAALQMIG